VLAAGGREAVDPMCAQTAIVDVDPEILQARLQAVEDPVARHWAKSISDITLKALVRVHEIDLPSLERDVADKSSHELWSEANDSVAAMWLELEELRQLMQPLVQAYEAKHGDDSIIGSLTDEPEEATTEPVAEMEIDGILGRIAETAWAMTFVLAGEVQQFRGRLVQVLKIPEAWELAGALQDHLDHVRSAVSAILSGVYASLPRAGQEEEDENVEVLLARELRARVFELRDAILVIEQKLKTSSPADWQPTLAEARDRVEKFIFGPGFAWMRAPDKRTFIRQRRTLTEILMMYSPLRAEPARQTVENLARFLEAMEMLNQRESLMVHDRAALEGVVQHMERALASDGPEARTHIGAGLAALSEAQGRDHVLDALLAKTLAPGSPVPVENILERSREVLKQFGG